MAKRGTGEGTIRQRSRNLWEGQYTAGRKEDGSYKRGSVYGKTKAEVVDKLAAITSDVRTGLFLPPDQITVGQWSDIWLDEYTGGIKKSTVSNYRYNVRNNIKPYIGGILLQKVTTPIIQKMYNQLHDKGLSAKSIKNAHGVMHKILEKAVQCRYIHFNPADACELPKVQKKEMLILQGNNLKAFLAEIKGKQHEHLFFVDLFTGMRQAEIMGLTWDCVDFDEEVIRIEKQLKRERQADGTNKYVFDSLKNGKTRAVAPAPVVFSVLKQVKREQAQNKLKYGTSYSNEQDLVFTTPLGEHLCAQTLLHCLKRRAEAIGLPGLRFHDLRHTYATLSIQNGDDIKTVSDSLGHATVAFTLDVYGHVTEKMKKDSANRMQSYINSIGG